MARHRTAVIDLGSNSFRLVVFTAADGWWKRTDEIYLAVRVGEGLDATGELGEQPMQRALEAADVFAHFCTAMSIPSEDVQPVATSAIRDASNQKAFLKRVRRETGLQVRVLAKEEEAYYGYLAAVNSTTLADGVVLDLGGGSLQLVEVNSRHPGRAGLVAARRRAHDRALPARPRRGAEEGAQGAARARRAHARHRRAVAAARRPAPRRHRGHDPQPRRRRAGRGGHAVDRRPGL